MAHKLDTGDDWLAARLETTDMARQTTGEIVITAVIDRIAYGPDGIGSPLEAAFTSASRYVAESARNPGDPWDSEATFTYDGSTYTVSGHSGD